MFDQIEDTRLKLKLSKSQMCRKLKVCRRTYVNWQNGVKPQEKKIKKRLKKLIAMA